MSNGPYIVDETCLVFAKNIEEENERLRAENEKFFKQAEMNARLLTENASLRAEIEKLRRDVRTAVMGDSAELADVKRENEKLREALKSILNDVGYHNPMRMTTEISDKILEDAAGALNDNI